MYLRDAPIINFEFVFGLLLFFYQIIKLFLPFLFHHINNIIVEPIQLENGLLVLPVRKEYLIIGIVDCFDAGFVLVVHLYDDVLDVFPDLFVR